MGKIMKLKNVKICVLGLGYVGLPLAVEFGKHFPTIGYDIDRLRVQELLSKFDKSGQISESNFEDAQFLSFTDDFNSMQSSNVYIVTVPTPIDENYLPDLSPLVSVSRMLGSKLSKGDIVIYESTVYPGATEEICVPLLEEFSGLNFNKNFYCGYSPERINPGDKINTISTIVKVVSGSTDIVANFISDLYGTIVSAGVYLAPSIRVAEAAKVIENVQRDLNIALVNELAMIFSRMGISTIDVLKAAETKWNFVKMRPGLVGGHCIGVDPYYLTYKATQVGYTPNLIMAGRRVNENMSLYVAHKLIDEMVKKKKHVVDSRILVMGVTFKENCSDLRNTKVLDVIKELTTYNARVDIFDPNTEQGEIKKLSGISPINKIPSDKTYDSILIAVPHHSFLELGIDAIRKAGKSDCVIFDLKGMFPDFSEHVVL
jgi:UDP-N-acetyl-D-glucosamine/UDP-N-acetyl-D-galactosamine dehydrogenase